MKTSGTAAQTLTDADLRTVIGSAALDVYEAVIQNLGDYELSFAIGTLDQLSLELGRRSPQALVGRLGLKVSAGPPPGEDGIPQDGWNYGCGDPLCCPPIRSHLR